MKIKSVQISNILSFQHFDDITDAPLIQFDNAFNILIGPNGSGKSTALEAINFVLTQVLFRSTNFQPQQINGQERWDTVQVTGGWQTGGFRIQKNYNYLSENQKIRVEIGLDEIDMSNISKIRLHQDQINDVLRYSSRPTDATFPETFESSFAIDVIFDSIENSWTELDLNSPGIKYLVFYNFFNDLIKVQNLINVEDRIEFLFSSVVKISGYRNYDVFAPNVSLAEPAERILNDLINASRSLSMNSNSKEEPLIFKVIRYRLGQIHQNLVQEKFSVNEATELANNGEFLSRINASLQIINLKIGLKLSEIRTWAYTLELTDTGRDSIVSDINQLSAGQKSLLHLILEAYGLGDLKGGVIIIDEPELHLHYQFQSQYISVIKSINEVQKCQYILVTHSESLIDSTTIKDIKRFSLVNGYTQIKSPLLPFDVVSLMKILDLTRSTYAFFAKHVILVEGITDLYFFKAVLFKLYPTLVSSIAVLEMGGKHNYENWKTLFSRFGMQVSFIGDFDNLFSLPVGGTPLITGTEITNARNEVREANLSTITPSNSDGLRQKIQLLIAEGSAAWEAPNTTILEPLRSQLANILSVANFDVVARIKANVLGIDSMIEGSYANGIYILKNGALEAYTGLSKNVGDVVNFCNSDLDHWLVTDNEYTNEIKEIMRQISLQL